MGSGKLYDAAPQLLGDLMAAAAQFRIYEALHRAKGTEDSIQKAEVNKELADQFEATIRSAGFIPHGYDK